MGQISTVHGSSFGLGKFVLCSNGVLATGYSVGLGMVKLDGAVIEV